MRKPSIDIKMIKLGFVLSTIKDYELTKSFRIPPNESY